jgi:hypothetical protein
VYKCCRYGCIDGNRTTVWEDLGILLVAWQQVFHEWYNRDRSVKPKVVVSHPEIARVASVKSSRSNVNSDKSIGSPIDHYDDHTKLLNEELIGSEQL